MISCDLVSSFSTKLQVILSLNTLCNTNWDFSLLHLWFPVGHCRVCANWLWTGEIPVKQWHGLFLSCWHTVPSGWNSVQWFVGTLLCEQLFGIVDDLIRITTAVSVCGCMCWCGTCVESPVIAPLSLFCCRAETERGLNRKHIIEGKFPSPPLCPSCHPITHMPAVLG